MKKKISILFSFLGINPVQFFNNLKGLGWFLRDYNRVKKQLKNNSDFKIASFYPCLLDKSDKAGVNSGHYFHQDLLVAGDIFTKNPNKHIDVGSRVDGFVAHVASYRQIEVIDIRKLKSNIRNVKFVQLNICNHLPEHFIGITDSISCLHAIEHFGLGRYGDPIDVNSHLTAISNFIEMLTPGGMFYLSTPIGPQRIEFNAHRVFSVEYLLGIFAPYFIVEDFYYVNDLGDLIHPKNISDKDRANNFDCTYGCGIFFLRKKAS